MEIHEDSEHRATLDHGRAVTLGLFLMKNGALAPLSVYLLPLFCVAKVSLP